MDIFAHYLLNQHPLQHQKIMLSSFLQLDQNDWFLDQRMPPGFKIYNKIFVIDDRHYRVVIRFSKQAEHYQLDVPFPIAIIHTEAIQVRKSYGIETRFKDLKVYHSNQYISAYQMMEQGIPSNLFQQITEDLNQLLISKE